MARYYYYLSNLFSIPLHLVFFISILLFIAGFTWYINYESAFEETMKQVKLFLMLSPLILLLLLHFLSSSSPDGGANNSKSWVRFFVPYLPEREAFHRAGGSPWGVALLLVFLLFMISHQSSLHERWFPLVTKCS